MLTVFVKLLLEPLELVVYFPCLKTLSQHPDGHYFHRFPQLKTS